MNMSAISKMPAIYLRLEPTFSATPFKIKEYPKEPMSEELKKLVDELKGLMSNRTRSLRVRRDGTMPNSSEGDIVAYDEPEAINDIHRWEWWGDGKRRRNLLKFSFIYHPRTNQRSRIVWLP